MTRLARLFRRPTRPQRPLSVTPIFDALIAEFGGYPGRPRPW
jgi:hypothetical protein